MRRTLHPVIVKISLTCISLHSQPVFSLPILSLRINSSSSPSPDFLNTHVRTHHIRSPAGRYPTSDSPRLSQSCTIDLSLSSTHLPPSFFPFHPTLTFKLTYTHTQFWLRCPPLSGCRPRYRRILFPILTSCPSSVLLPIIASLSYLNTLALLLYPFPTLW